MCLRILTSELDSDGTRGIPKVFAHLISTASVHTESPVNELIRLNPNTSLEFSSASKPTLNWTWIKYNCVYCEALSPFSLIKTALLELTRAKYSRFQEPTLFYSWGLRWTLSNTFKTEKPNETNETSLCHHKIEFLLMLQFSENYSPHCTNFCVAWPILHGSQRNMLITVSISGLPT